MKGIEQCFPVVLFIMLYTVVLTFESVDEILKCDDSNVMYAVQGCSNFWVCGWKSEVWHLNDFNVALFVQQALSLTGIHVFSNGTNWENLLKDHTNFYLAMVSLILITIPSLLIYVLIL